MVLVRSYQFLFFDFNTLLFVFLSYHAWLVDESGICRKFRGYKRDRNIIPFLDWCCSFSQASKSARQVGKNCSYNKYNKYTNVREYKCPPHINEHNLLVTQISTLFFLLHLVLCRLVCWLILWKIQSVYEGDLFLSIINYELYRFCTIDEKSKYLFHIIEAIYQHLKYLFIFRCRLIRFEYHDIFQWFIFVHSQCFVLNL